MANSVSPDGRYVTGSFYPSTLTRDTTAFRYDRLTGEFLQAVLESADNGGGMAVGNDGRVYGNKSNGQFGYFRPFRWTPASNQYDLAYNPADPDRAYTVYGISRDGQYGFGGLSGWFVQYPVLFPFWQTTGPIVPIELEISPGQAALQQGSTLRAVTDPINGTRRAYGSLLFNSDQAAAIWTLGFPQPTQDFSWDSITQVTPDGALILGVVGNNTVIRGDGPDRTLTPPLSPFFTTNPSAAAMSDDGQVAVGWAIQTSDSAREEPVVWRKGQQPATLPTILAGAGIGFPPYYTAYLSSVSADGAVVTGAYADSTFSYRGFVAVLPALNDACASARPVTYGTWIASTLGATRAGVSSTCATEGSSPDIWFSFSPLANETVAIDTCGSSFDTTLSIFQGPNCATLGSPIACNDEAFPACPDNVHASRLSAAVFAGTTYFIRVAGWSGASGSVRLTITAPNRPANDACAQATDVTPGVGVPFNNSNAITDSRPPCGGTPFNDVWFRCVAPETGRMTFSTCGSTINTVMAVYDAAACADLAMPAIACGSANSACTAIGGGNGTRITVPCTVGQTLLIRVGGFLGASGGGQFLATFACTAEAGSNYSLAVLNSGALDYWRFEDQGHATAADSRRFDPFSCGDAPGQYIGNVIRGQDIHGKSLRLDGSGAYARVSGTFNITNPSQCLLENGRAAMEAWIKTSDPLAGVVLTNRTDPSEFSMTFVVGYNTVGIPNTAGRLMFIADGPGNFHGAISNGRVDDGNWHHIVGYRSAAPNHQYTLVIDNVVQGTSNLPGVGTAHSGVNGSYWNIGNGPAWPVADAAFNGRIDDVAIYCGNPDLSGHYTIGRPCPADYDQDGLVQPSDVAFFVSTWFNCLQTGALTADFDRNGIVQPADVALFINTWLGALANGC